MDLVDWLQEIRDCLWYQKTMIWIGFSFLCENVKTGDIIYIFSCIQLAPYHKKFSSVKRFNDFIDEFKGKTHHDILNETFISQKEDNPFANSGFRPYKLVCNYIWIRK